MKRLFTILITLTLLLGLTACGQVETQSNPGQSQTQQEGHPPRRSRPLPTNPPLPLSPRRRQANLTWKHRKTAFWWPTSPPPATPKALPSISRASWMPTSMRSFRKCRTPTKISITAMTTAAPTRSKMILPPARHHWYSGTSGELQCGVSGLPHLVGAGPQGDLHLPGEL